MSTRDKLEYQKNLRFIREAAESKAKLGSPELKLAKIKQESDLTKPVLTLGDKHNKVAQRKEPKSANEVPKTRETSRVADPVKAGEHGDNCLDVNLDDIDYARISESRHHDEDEDLPSCYCEYPDTCEVCEPRSQEEGGGSGDHWKDHWKKYEEDGMKRDRFLEEKHEDEEELDDGFDLETGRLVDRDEEGDDYGVIDTDEVPVSPHRGGHLREATSRQKNAKQSLARHKASIKDKRTKSMKHKSNAALKKESTMTLGDIFLNELSSLNKEVLPGSGDISKQMKDFDELLQKFTKDALELHEKITDEMKTDLLGGQTSPQMAPRIGERNRMLMVRAGILRKLAAACTSAIAAARAEG